MSDDSEIFLHKENCPSCGSRDNLGRYADGHGFCFGCDYLEPAEEGSKKPKAPSSSKPVDLISIDRFDSIKSRKITDLTCHHMKYGKGTYNGQPCQVVNIPDQEGNIVAQKIRLPNKEFRFIGDTKAAGLVFQDRFPRGSSKKVVITEGEIDALSVSQAQGNKNYAVVSLPNGATAAAKVCAASYDYLNAFDEIIVMFDMDEPGREATKVISKLFGSKALIAELPEKDANECLKQGNSAAIVEAIWSAQAYRPEGVVALSSMEDSLDEETVEGKPWIYDTLTAATYGRREGELYFIGAGSGIGKTDFFLQQAVADIKDGEGVALFLLEQPIRETTKRLCGKQAKQLFHVPEIEYKQEDLKAAFKTLSSQKCFLYDHFGSKDWETVAENIRWLSVTEGVKHFYVDHLTALASHEEDERRALERICAEMSGLAQELGIYLYVISHLATPEGKPHEEGGRVMARHFKGARAIIFWAHFMFGLERNTQAEDLEVRHTTTFRVLKDRFTGRANGLTFYLGFERETGILYEREEGWRPPDDESAGSGFTPSGDY